MEDLQERGLKMREVVILGAGMHKFGRFPEKSFVDLAEVAIVEALKDAGIQWPDVQALYAANALAGPSTGNNVIQRMGQTGIPAINVEAYCAGGLVACKLAYQAIATGFCDIAVAVGFEKQERGFIPVLGAPWWETRLGLHVMPGDSALDAQRHMHLYGTTREQLAKIAVKNHRNAALAPYAHLPNASLTVEEVLNSTMICEPLTMLMISAPSDGAAALVLCSQDVVRKHPDKKPVTIAAITHNTAKYFDLEYEINEARRRAAREAYEMAGCGPEDLDFALLHDATVIFEIRQYEEVGLCQEGEGGRLIDEGITELSGRVPVNTDGGFLGRGNAPSADSGSWIAEAVWQLRGEAGPRQVPDAKIGLICHGGYGVPIHGAAMILKR